MTSLFVFTCLIALNLLIWFRTDAWLEYTRLFRLNFLSFYKDFDTKHKEDVSLEYLHYLRLYHNCFVIRLITCPVCLAVWMGIFFGVITAMWLTPGYIVGGLLLFTVIDKLLG